MEARWGCLIWGGWLLLCLVGRSDALPLVYPGFDDFDNTAGKLSDMIFSMVTRSTILVYLWVTR